MSRNLQDTTETLPALAPDADLGAHRPDQVATTEASVEGPHNTMTSEELRAAALRYQAESEENWRRMQASMDQQYNL